MYVADLTRDKARELGSVLNDDECSLGTRGGYFVAKLKKTHPDAEAQKPGRRKMINKYGVPGISGISNKVMRRTP